MCSGSWPSAGLWASPVLVLGGAETGPSRTGSRTRSRTGSRTGPRRVEFQTFDGIKAIVFYVFMKSLETSSVIAHIYVFVKVVEKLRSARGRSHEEPPRF